MRCRRCKQPDSPIYGVWTKLDLSPKIEVLQGCAGYLYDPNHKQDYPHLLMIVQAWGALELVNSIFTNLHLEALSWNVPSRILYNGAKQFVVELNLPADFPVRDKMLEEAWKEVDQRIASAMRGDRT